MTLAFAAFGGLPRSNKVRIVLGSPARKIVMDDIPWYLALYARVSFVWWPFFRVIEGANHNTMSLRRAYPKRAATVGAEAALQPSRRLVMLRHTLGESQRPFFAPLNATKMPEG